MEGKVHLNKFSQRAIPILLVLAALVVSSAAFGGAPMVQKPSLQKACAELSDFYDAYLESRAMSEATAESRTNARAHENFDIVDHFRKTIQFSENEDTIWVKVALTVDSDNKGAAVEKLSGLGLRRVTRFGTLITGMIPVQLLPGVDQLKVVERIEPVTPSAYTARSSVPGVATISATSNYPSKKN